MTVKRPQETLRELTEMFPSFGAWWAEEEGDFPPEDGLVDNVYYEWTHHHVLQEFLIYFGKNAALVSPKQLKKFGGWINAAVIADDDLENAVSTCFLEHTNHVRGPFEALRPYLSKLAKARSRA